MINGNQENVQAFTPQNSLAFAGNESVKRGIEAIERLLTSLRPPFRETATHLFCFAGIGHLISIFCGLLQLCLAYTNLSREFRSACQAGVSAQFNNKAGSSSGKAFRAD